MQYASCTLDGVVWEASRFSLLIGNDLEAKRNNLNCVECGALAWFRRASKHGHPAHFCAHHEQVCQLKAEYVLVDSDAPGNAEAVDQVQNSGNIVVHLDEEQGGSIDVLPPNVNPDPLPGPGGRRYVVQGADQYANQQFTLRRILHRLVQSPDFRNSTANITFYRREGEPYLDGPVRDVTRAFSDLSPADNGESKFYWGPITSVGRTDDGRIWLNSSPRYQSVSVVIFQDIVDEFLEAFEIDELDDLVGAHVLVSGRCHFLGHQNSKPIVWCSGVQFIVLRRYRSSSLQIAG